MTTAAARGNADDPIQLDSSASSSSVLPATSSDSLDPRKRKAAELSPPVHYRSLQAIQPPIQVQPSSNGEPWRPAAVPRNVKPQKILPSPANAHRPVPVGRTIPTQLVAGVQPVVKPRPPPLHEGRQSPFPATGGSIARPSPRAPPFVPRPAAPTPPPPAAPTAEGHIVTAASFAPNAPRWERAIFHPKPGHPLPPPGHPDTSDATLVAGLLPTTAPRPLLPLWTHVPHDEAYAARVRDNEARKPQPSEGVPPVWASKRRGLTSAVEYYREPMRTAGGSVYVSEGVARGVVFEGKLGDGYGFWGTGKSVGTFVVPL